uniref:YqaJ viral recombinase domain-containing protein n=1 Tax=Sparus aurata TaxID=8175 RepID=A0A671VR44_SPAAU
MVSLRILKKIFWIFTNIFFQCLIVEEETREQSRSRVWFDQRAGRVTALVFSEAARADAPTSLIKRICYPHASRFSTEATRWGQENEDRARQHFVAMMKDHHKDFQMRPSGFIINPELPWIGASPDGMIACTCHGDSVLEIKCPFKSRNCSLMESCRDSSFCLGLREDGVMALKQNHKYMYQVQAQMHIAEVGYCHFMVWTPQEIFTQQIPYDPVLFDDAYVKVENFIKTGVLPELLGKWYTAPRFTPRDTAVTNQAPEV